MPLERHHRMEATGAWDVWMVVLCLAANVVSADEAVLPDPLVMNSGERVTTPEQWRERRAEIVEMLLTHEYGHIPPAPGPAVVAGRSSVTALDGAATLERLTLALGPSNALHIETALYLPTDAPGPFPVILAVDSVWLEHHAPVAREVVRRGYIFAGFDRHGFDADNADRSDGVHPLYPDYDWASVAAWAWGAMRIVDYLVSREDVEETRIALTGHSRAGKVALLAGGLDERIALVAPHASGAGGAGSFMASGKDCETLELITQPERFHYWFHPRLREYAGKEATMPFDQHFLKALVAPRTLVTLEASGDLWANPYGTRMTHLAAQPVFELLGAGNRNRIHFREGGHDMTDDDWTVLLDMADQVFKGASDDSGG